jgi:small GTP-binding protein
MKIIIERLPFFLSFNLIDSGSFRVNISISKTLIIASMGAATLKIVVVGQSGVGKTALLKRLFDDTIDEISTTIGVEFLAYHCEIDGQRIRLQIWDTAGQERFRAVARSYLRNTLGALLVFDLTDRASFHEAHQWLLDVRQLGSPNCAVLLIGNKCDCEARGVTQTEILQYAEAQSVGFLETSALEGTNVKTAFLRIARDVRDRIQNGVLVPPAPPVPVIPLEEAPPGKCC